MKATNIATLLIIVFGICPLLLQGQISFEAVCNHQEVLTGVPFEVSFQLRNANIKQLQPPPFNGLQARGPSTSQSFSHINGKSTTVQAHNYTLYVNKPGTYKIGKAKVITASGKTMYTKAFTIKAVDKSTTADAELAGKVFIRTELSNSEAVVGEQITVDIKIFTQIGIEELTLVKTPSFGNLFTHQLRNFRANAVSEVIDGEYYRGQIIHRMLVFPSDTGTIIVEPAIVDIGLLSNKGSGQFNINTYYIVPYTLKSMPIELNVKQLPPPPSTTDFSGAVGQYRMLAHANKNTISSDDVVELTLQVRGKGDLKQILAPNLNINKKYFEQFKPNIEVQENKVNGFLGGIKQFKYILTPKALGDFELNPSFTFFDPEQKRYVTFDTTINVHVNQGKNPLPTKAARDTMKELVFVPSEEKESLLDFKSPQSEARFVQPSKTSFLGSIFFWILSILPFLGLFGLFKWKEKQELEDNVPDAERKRFNAGSQAATRLQNAQKCLKKGDSTTFFNEISKALLGFVGDKYNIPKVELTKNNLRQQLASKTIATEKIDSLMSILQQCDMAVFAGLANNDAMEKIYKESADLIQLMDQNA